VRKSKDDKAGSHVYNRCLSQRGKMRCGKAAARGGVEGRVTSTASPPPTWKFTYNIERQHGKI
jgi:hypothetical protein